MALGKSLTLVVLVVGLMLAGSGSSATTAIPGCKLVSYTVRVNFDDTRHNNILDHAFDARRAGHPRTLRIARHEADANRKSRSRGSRRSAASTETNTHQRCPTRAVRARASATSSSGRTGAPEG